MIVQKKPLLTALKHISGSIQSKGTLPILGHVLFSLTENELLLKANNLESQTVASIVLEDNTEWEDVAIPSEIIKIVGSLQEDSIVFRTKDKLVEIEQGDTLISLPTLPANNFPAFDGSADIQCEIPINGEQFKAGLKAASSAAGKNDVRYYLNGVLLQVKHGVMLLVGSDGHRLAMWKCDVESNAVRVIIPNPSVQAMLKTVPNQDVLIQITERAITIEGFSSTLIDGNYPDIERVIPIIDRSITVNAQQLAKATSNCLLVTEKMNSPAIRLEAMDGYIKIESHGGESKFSTRIECEDSTESFGAAGFNPKYIASAAGLFHGDIQLEANQGLTSFQLSSYDSKVSCVVMPMRL